MELNSTGAKLYGLITQAKNAMARLVTPFAAGWGLTPIQLLILAQLDCSGCPLNVSGLSRKLEMNQGNVSTQCKRLEKAGYLTRTRSAEDERVVTLALTPQGRAAMDSFHAFMAGVNSALAQTLPALLDTAFTGLEALTQIFDQMAQPSQKGTNPCSN